MKKVLKVVGKITLVCLFLFGVMVSSLIGSAVSIKVSREEAKDLVRAYSTLHLTQLCVFGSIPYAAEEQKELAKEMMRTSIRFRGNLEKFAGVTEADLY